MFVNKLSNWLISKLSLVCFIIILIQVSSHTEDDHDDKLEADNKRYQQPRYLLYDVNPGEGFNLRRDVYMRMAVLARNLNDIEPWILVLPPWSRLYHWKSRDIGSQNKLPWSSFFDVESLKRFVHVIEFEEFLESNGNLVDEVYYLQNYAEGWDKWEEKMDKRPCIIQAYHQDPETELWNGWFFGYDDAVVASHFECVSVMGHAGFLKPFLLANTSARSVMLDRAETVLHDRFGDSVFWQVRRSMRFSNELRRIADEFRSEFLDSTDEKDLTVIDDDWRNMKKKHGEAQGGPYLAVHLRRADFVRVRQKEVPSLLYAAQQIKEFASKYNLDKIYIATDAPDKEFLQIEEHIGPDYSVYRFKPTQSIRKKYKDGGIAIIDQWICAHGRFFIGTKESTFSFRIQDEREILGFDPDMTFNRLCTEMDEECEQPTRWRITY